MQDKRAKVSHAASQEKDNDLSSGTPNLQGSSLSETENWNSIDFRMDDADKSCNDALSSAEAMVTNDDKHVDEYNIGEVNSSVVDSSTKQNSKILFALKYFLVQGSSGLP